MPSKVPMISLCYSTRSSTRYSRISPGVHCNSRQMASRVLRRMALALPVLRMEKLAWVRPMRSASSLERILRFASITSMLMIIIVFSFLTRDCGTRDTRPISSRVSRLEVSCQTVKLFSSTASAATLYMKAKKSRKKGVTKLVCWN